MRRRHVAAFTALLTAGAGCAAFTAGTAHTVATAPAARAATAVTQFNGKTSDRAAPSCWAIKQSYPSSASGLYWLLTPTLVRPQVFYCDMTTDGGGWELIARGRDGWSFSYAGQGSAAAVALTPTGTSAFAPATLPSSTVDGLLDGHAPSTAFDGFRVRRATNSAGTTWQEARIHFAFLDHFTWEWELGQPLTTVSFGANSATVGPQNTHYSGSTYDARIDSAWQLIHTGVLVNHNQRKGFAYGSSIHGNSSSNSYLWAPTAADPNGSYALPFTQVYIRPHLGDADVHFATIPSSGLAALPIPPTPSNIPQRMDWGVGIPQIPNNDPDPDGTADVYALAQIGDTMYVGGKFERVLHHSTGTYAVQPWLAAFNLDTGVWVRTFLPQLDGAVFDLAATPNNKLLVAGNFTNIDGVSNTAGLAEIDPDTGQPVAGWQASLSGPKFNNVGAAYARAIYIGSDNNVYVAGDFKQIVGSSQTVTTGGIARVALADGTPDTAWHPFANATVMDIQLSNDGTRVYVAGNFTKLGTNNTNGAAGSYDDGVAVIDPSSGQPDTSFVSMHNNQPTHGQDAVAETPSLFVHGGQQWWIAGYDKPNLTFVRGSVEQPHGDIQVLQYADGLVFGGCHCGTAVTYQDYPNQYTRADSIDWLGAWDPATLERVPAFAPQIGAVTQGVWETTVDSDQCLWAGGDIDHGPSTSNWLSGFARFCPPDLTVPTTPGPESVHGGMLWWNRSYDTGGGTPSYEILRNDRVVAITASNRIVPPGHGLYFVRAIDAAGNRSATTRAIWV
ncbi:MAG TPA: fibrinogen-like YCDxxxxGGGW domain-containing protein [Acidimicrobiia bacterium]